MVEYVLPVVVDAFHVGGVGSIQPRIQLINHLLVDNCFKFSSKVVLVLGLEIKRKKNKRQRRQKINNSCILSGKIMAKNINKNPLALRGLEICRACALLARRTKRQSRVIRNLE